MASKETLESADKPLSLNPELLSALNGEQQQFLLDLAENLQEQLGTDWDWNRYKKNIDAFAEDDSESVIGELALLLSQNANLHQSLQDSVETHLQKLNESVESPTELITDFYNSPQLEALYKQAQALKKPGERVTSADIGALLQKGTEDDKSLYELLVSDEHKRLSATLWEKSDVKRKAKEAFEGSEIKDIAEFFKDLSEVPPEDQNDVKKLIAAFEKKFPQYTNKVDSDWYQKRFTEQMKALKGPELKILSDFYESEDFKKICNQLSQTLGQAPVWKDIVTALKAAGFEDMVNLAAKHEAESTAMTEKIWQREEAKFNALENQEFSTFTDSLKAEDFKDLDALAARFQQTRKRYAGSKRLDWYKEKLGFKKRLKESEWRGQMDSFYANQLPSIYAEVTREKNGRAPEWQDIKAKLQAKGDTDTLYILENVFKNESEAKWKTYWEAEKEKFNETGNEQIGKFMRRLKPAQLDSYETAKADFEQENPGLKADEKWFKPEYEKAYAEALNSYNTKHEALVNTLPDQALANAMQTAFKSASTFAERSKWLAENKQKVSEYAALINENKQTESRLAEQTNVHPDLKKELNQIQGKYEAGKSNYAQGFYSPRKYTEALNDLSAKLQAREALSANTISAIENKTFSQIPKLTDKKKLTYDEFRDALKKLDFYKLDPAVRKNEKVRAAAREKTKALHAQWLDHRTLHIEQNKRVQIEKSQSVISRVKLPKGMPDGVKDYAAFTVALKEKGVYDALPKGVLKNETVRATAHAQNLEMWAQYQTQQEKVTPVDKETEVTNDPKLKEAENTIKGVKLDSALQLKLVAKLAGKDAKDANTFTVALRELQVYGGVDASVWKNPELREQAWQNNMKLQKEFLDKTDKDVLETPQTQEDKEQNENYGLPGHYKINWKDLDNRLNPDEKKRAIDRFKEMHNRSEIGLQTVMQQFHQPLGTFILETLAVMPKDKYDKAMNALKDTRVEANNREQASNWLKVLCESAGLSFLEKETSAGWSQLKQNFNAYFGTSLDKAWEVETAEVEDEVAVTTETDDLKPNAPVAEVEEDRTVTDDKKQTSTQDEDEIVEAPSAPEAVENTDLAADEPETEPDTQDTAEADEEPVIEHTTEAVMPDLEGPDLTVNDDALDTPEIEEETLDVEAAENEIEPELEDAAETEPELEEASLDTAETDEKTEAEPEDIELDDILPDAVESDLDESLEDESPADLETQEEADETVEASEDADDDTALEDNDAEPEDLETDENVDDTDTLENDDEKNLEATEDVDNTKTTDEDLAEAEVFDNSADIDADELLADAEDFEASVDVEAEVDDEDALEATETEDETDLETEDEAEVTPEVIPVVHLETKEREAAVHEAVTAWQNFTETNLPIQITSEAADLKKQFSEILKTGLDEATIAKLKASGSWEKLMASPLHQQLLRTHLKQHEALNNEGLHFFTTLQQELYFSSSVTVNKFLEQLKSYVQFTKQVSATISTPPSGAEISKETAQALFKAFATKFHSRNQIKTLSLEFENKQLKVVVAGGERNRVWHFAAHELQDA